MTERSFSHPDDPNNNFVRLNMKSNTRQHKKYEYLQKRQISVHSYIHRRELDVLHQHEIMATYSYHFLVVITQFFSWMIFINNRICKLTGAPG